MNILVAACCLVFLPLKKLQVTSCYGYRSHPVTGRYSFHNGVDLRAKADTVYAITGGRVKAAGYNGALGIFIRLDHGLLESVYGHLSQPFVHSGQWVRGGQPIGITGASGTVTGEHLHLSINYRGQGLDPIQFLYQCLIQQDHE